MLLMVRWEIHLTSLLVLQKEPALHFLPITFSPLATLQFMVSTDTFTLIMQLTASTSLETFWIHNLTPNTIEPIHQINYLFISGSQDLSFASSLTVPFNKSKKKTHTHKNLPAFLQLKFITKVPYFLFFKDPTQVFLTQRKFLFDGQWIFK